MSEPSDLERALLFQLRALGLPEPELEYRFAPPRRWRFDLAWPSTGLIPGTTLCEPGPIRRPLAVEVQGGGFARHAGRHSRPAAQEGEWEKLNTAQLLGWRVLQFGPKAIESGAAATMIQEALKR